jgi:hypothetical protein
MTNFTLQFDGYRLSLVGDGAVIKSWDAVSGSPGFQSPANQAAAFTGPIPEGRWSFNTSAIQTISVKDDVVGTLAKAAYATTGLEQVHVGTWFGGSIAWGLERAFLTPADGTDVFGRSNFSIHGGDQYGSAGCIDLGHNEVDFFATLTQSGISNVTLDVSYDPSLFTNPQPLAGTFLPTRPLSHEA